MRMTGIATYLLGAAAGLAWMPLAAQMPSSSGSTQSMGSAQNPVNPSAPAVSSNNASPFATDLSASGAGGTDAQLMRDKIFVRMATEGVYAEQTFGQLAVQKATSAEVKHFAQRMVDDHAMLSTGIQPVQDKMGIRVPSKLDRNDQVEYDKLNALSGADFDKEYLSATVKAHRRELDDFQAEEAATNDPALKDVASKGEKVVYFHLRYANKLAVANGVAPALPPTAPPQ